MYELDDIYRIKEMVRVRGLPEPIPLYDIPMMSDEQWQKLAQRNAVENYKKATGRIPASVGQACRWQRAQVARMEAHASV